MRYLLTTCLTLALALSGTAQDQDKDLEKAPLDDQFLLKAASANHAVIKLTDLVESRSENEKVEAFARKVQADHKVAADKLGRIAQERKLGVVAGLEKDLQQEMDRVSDLKGPEFDQAFLDTFIRWHEKCLQMCKGQTTGGQEVPTVAFAKECSTMIEDHLTKAKELRKSLGN